MYELTYLLSNPFIKLTNINGKKLSKIEISVKISEFTTQFNWLQ